MVNLAISHTLFLTKEQRYSLVKREEIDIIGVSCPVWFSKKGTSEPAEEVFCSYKLTNYPPAQQVRILKNGYQINLPQETEIEKLSFSVFNLPKLDLPTAENLLDISDGGSEWLFFQEYKKMKSNKIPKNYNLLHYVEIKPIEILYNSLI